MNIYKNIFTSVNSTKVYKMFITIILLGTCALIIQLFLIPDDGVDTFFSDTNIPVILWWTPFGGNDDVRICGSEQCYFTHNRTFQSHESLKSILFYGSDFRIEDLPNWRSAYVQWGLIHEESPRNNPIFVHEKTLNLFNYSATFSRFSNVPLMLIDLPGLAELLGKKYFVPTEEKTALMKKKNLASILYIQSDCDTASDRDLYVIELMKYIKIDSYGSCVNNVQLDEKLKDNYLEVLNSDGFLSFVARYKFTIAFENAICNDYITEKLWRPLIVGSVPIYYGSPTFKDWLPNNTSAISVLDFATPKKLAEFLINLAENDLEYEQYLSHKLAKEKYRITNYRLIHELEKRQIGVSNEFGKYVEEFECFVCKQIQNTVISKNTSILTKKHYDCPIPKNPLSGEIDKYDWWVYQWVIEKCGSKLLAHYLSNNISINMKQFNEQKLKMYDENNC